MRKAEVLSIEKFYDENHTASRSKLINSVEYVRFDECITLMETYHKAKVNAISDEDKKELISSIRTAPSRKDADDYFNWWFKNKLLEQ